MKYKLFILFLPLFIFSLSLQAQLEKVIVEKYYISDQFDSTDTIGGKLDSGSVTYRIYIDMQPGYQLQSIYGDKNHALKISSTAPFFNNIDRGQSLGKDIPVNRLYENTVALDTWLTLGQVTKAGAKTYFGVLKTQDKDSSIIGGVNNNDSLLVNKNPAAGIPLTTADGMETLVKTPSNWQNYGILDLISGIDSTIFGSAKVGSQFISNNAGVLNSGVMGVNPDSNLVIVAQLTTKGELSFELNLKIADSLGKSINYVADYIAGGIHNDSLLTGEVLSRYLKYPFQLLCGCPDPNYVEYNPSRDCDNKDSCHKGIVFGCMDPLACNYDPNANFSVPNLCCYPGYCNDQNIAFVCRTIPLNIAEPSADFEFTLYPSPAQNQLNIKVASGSNKPAYYELYDYSGKLLLKKNMGFVSGTVTEQLDISNFDNGFYLIHLYMGNISATKKFIKE